MDLKTKTVKTNKFPILCCSNMSVAMDSKAYFAKVILVALLSVVGLGSGIDSRAQTGGSSSAYIDPDYTGEKGPRLSSVISFRTGKILIDMNGMAYVEQIANYLKGSPSTKIVIEGYASMNSDEDACKRLSEERAVAVKKSLINTFGISASRIIANGRGIANTEVMQLRKSGDAVLVYEQKPKVIAQNNRTQKQNTTKKTRNNNGAGGKKTNAGSNRGNDAVNYVNNLMGNAIAYGMIGVMTGSDQTCRSCWGSGCADCNYSGKLYVVDKGVTDALFGAYSASANAEQGRNKKSKTIKDGYQKVTLDNGDILEGNFKNGTLNGQGKAYNKDGFKYVGSFKDSQLHGKGTLTFPTGEKYVGDFINGIREGHGTMVMPNGDKYVGSFKNNSPCGIGTLYIVEDKSYIKARWKDEENFEIIEQGTWNPTASKGKTTSKRK